MRILFDVPAFAMGGMERQIVDLASGLVARGHEVALVANKDSTDAYADLVVSSGVAFTVLGRMNRFDPRVFSDLLRILRRFRPDVVVCETFNATLWGRLAAIATGSPAVVAEHSSDRIAPRKEYWTNRILGPFTRSVIGCAFAQAPSLIADGQPERAIAIVHNGVDVAAFRADPAGGSAFRAEFGIPETAFVIGMVAANRPEKRHDRLIRIAEQLAATGVEFEACAIGGGPLLEQNRAQAARSVAADRIRFVGPRSDIVPAYNACDIVVLVSDSVETFPLSFLEAQSCGKPVVGMNVGGVAETFAPGLSGYLIDQGDETAMAHVLRDLSSDRARCRQMGFAGREFVEANFTVERMVGEYERILRDVVVANAARAGARV